MKKECRNNINIIPTISKTNFPTIFIDADNTLFPSNVFGYFCDNSDKPEKDIRPLFGRKEEVKKKDCKVWIGELKNCSFDDRILDSIWNENFCNADKITNERLDINLFGIRMFNGILKSCNSTNLNVTQKEKMLLALNKYFSNENMSFINVEAFKKLEKKFGCNAKYVLCSTSRSTMKMNDQDITLRRAELNCYDMKTYYKLIGEVVLGNSDRLNLDLGYDEKNSRNKEKEKAQSIKKFIDKDKSDTYYLVFDDDYKKIQKEFNQLEGQTNNSNIIIWAGVDNRFSGNETQLEEKDLRGTIAEDDGKIINDAYEKMKIIDKIDNNDSIANKKELIENICNCETYCEYEKDEHVLKFYLQNNDEERGKFNLDYENIGIECSKLCPKKEISDNIKFDLKGSINMFNDIEDKYQENNDNIKKELDKFIGKNNIACYFDIDSTISQLMYSSSELKSILSEKMNERDKMSIIKEKLLNQGFSCEVDDNEIMKMLKEGEKVKLKWYLFGKCVDDMKKNKCEEKDKEKKLNFLFKFFYENGDSIIDFDNYKKLKNNFITKMGNGKCDMVLIGTLRTRVNNEEKYILDYLKLVDEEMIIPPYYCTKKPNIGNSDNYEKYDKEFLNKNCFENINKMNYEHIIRNCDETNSIFSQDEYSKIIKECNISEIENITWGDILEINTEKIHDGLLRNKIDVLQRSIEKMYCINKVNASGIAFDDYHDIISKVDSGNKDVYCFPFVEYQGEALFSSYLGGKFDDCFIDKEFIIEKPLEYESDEEDKKDEIKNKEKISLDSITNKTKKGGLFESILFVDDEGFKRNDDDSNEDDFNLNKI